MNCEINIVIKLIKVGNARTKVSFWYCKAICRIVTETNFILLIFYYGSLRTQQREYFETAAFLSLLRII